MDTTYHSEAPSETPYARDRERSRYIWIAGLVLLGLVLIAAIWYIMASTREETASVARRDVADWESLRGEVVAPANSYAVVNCRCSAPVSRVFTSVGATVSRGDVLVELSHPTARAAYEAARSELLAARSSYEQARQTYLADVRAAQQRVAQAREQVQLAQRAYPPIEVPTGMETEAPQAGEKAAREAPPITFGPDLSAAEAQLEQARVQLTNAQDNMAENLTPYLQRRQAAEATFREAQAGLSTSLIRAPISGQVIEFNATPGQNVDQVADTVVATIADLSALRVHAELTDQQRDVIDPGTGVQLQFAQLPQEVFEGRVDEVQQRLSEVVSDQEQRLRHIAVISFFNRQGLVKPHMTGQALVKVKEVTAALSVPVGAIERDDQIFFVRVNRGGKWVRQNVQIGPSDGVYVAIIQGLQEGDVVRVDKSRNVLAEA